MGVAQSLIAQDKMDVAKPNYTRHMDVAKPN
jgi:hypothetical protein